MPQVFQVLKCYKCLVFQVHQTKKSNKFACKMCGDKQSIKRHYGIGNGQECRIHVQKLNCIRGEMLEDKDNQSDFNGQLESVEVSHAPKVDEIMKKINSKWKDFVNDEDITQVSDQNDDKMFLNDREVVLEIPTRKRQTKKACSFKNPSKSFENSNSNDTTSALTPRKKICADNRLYNNITNYNSVISTSKQYDNVLSDSSNIAYSDASIGKENNSAIKKCNSVESNSNNKLARNAGQIKTQVQLIKVNHNSKWNKFKDESDGDHLEMLENESLQDLSSPDLFEDKHKIYNIAVEQLKSGSDFYEHNEVIHSQDTMLFGVADKNSKWAEYDDSESTNNIIESEHGGSNQNSQNNLQKLFSLCNNEDELDEVLDI